MPKYIDLSSLGTPTNFINFNDFKASPLIRMEYWFASRRQVREFDIPLPEASGVDDFDTFIGKQYLVIKGRMFPGNDSEYNTGRDQLRSVASLAKSQHDSQSDRGYVPYKWTDVQPRMIMVKVLYVDLPETAHGGVIQPFTFVCKIKYPVAYAQSAQAGIINMSGTSGPTGGVYIPAMVPFLIGGANRSGSALPFRLGAVLGGSSGTSGALALNNIGNFETFPTMVINGPISKPRLTNNTSGKYVEFDINLTGTSDNLVLSYDQDTISITSNGVNVYGKMTAGASLFKIDPGPVSLSLSGATVGAGATAQVAFYPAWALS